MPTFLLKDVCLFTFLLFFSFQSFNSNSDVFSSYFVWLQPKSRTSSFAKTLSLNSFLNFFTQFLYLLTSFSYGFDRSAMIVSIRKLALFPSAIPLSSLALVRSNHYLFYSFIISILFSAGASILSFAIKF